MWLDRNKLPYEFIDYREHRVAPDTLKSWARASGGWEKLVNRSSPTWRNLPGARKSPASDPEWTLVIREYPALVRRPVVVLPDGAVSIGFTDKQFASLFPGA
jgi:Spx/MgsR family transcriptional regulator